VSEAYKWYGERAAQVADVVMRLKSGGVNGYAVEQAGCYMALVELTMFTHYCANFFHAFGNIFHIFTDTIVTCV
jgi:hypothetical protein